MPEITPEQVAAYRDEQRKKAEENAKEEARSTRFAEDREKFFPKRAVVPAEPTKQE